MHHAAHDQPPHIYRGFERVLIAQNRIGNALEVAEQGRSRAWANLAVTHLEIPSPWQPAVVSLSLEQIKQIAKTENATLVQYSVIYDTNQQYQLSGLRLSFDDPYAYAEALYIWVVQPNGRLVFRQVNLKRFWQQDTLFIASLVRNLRDAMRDGTDEIKPMITQSLQQLYQLLIAPIADLLPKDPSCRVVLIPQDFLFLVPFAALLDTDGVSLIEKHTLSMAPSIYALTLTAQNRQSQKRPVDPHKNLVITHSHSPTQPELKQEVIEVADLLKTSICPGEAVSKNELISYLKDAELIHFAAPMILDEMMGPVGAVLLGLRDGEDKFLTLAEVMALQLNAELVVLSQSEMSRGRVWGQGVMAVSQGWIAAGIPSLVVSLGSFPQTPSAFLMGEFYRNRQHLGDQIQALRQAILTTKQTYPHPRNWAMLTWVGVT
jgi:CHAT domain-containing protein